MKLSHTEQHDVLAIPSQLYSEVGTRYFKHLHGSMCHQNDAHAVELMVRNKSIIIVVVVLSLAT